MEIFAIVGGAAEPRLTSLGGTTRVGYGLTRDEQSIVLPNGEQIPIAVGRLAGRVERSTFESSTVRIQGWAADVRDDARVDRVLLFAVAGSCSRPRRPSTDGTWEASRPFLVATRRVRRGVPSRRSWQGIACFRGERRRRHRARLAWTADSAPRRRRFRMTLSLPLLRWRAFHLVALWAFGVSAGLFDAPGKSRSSCRPRVDSNGCGGVRTGSSRFCHRSWPSLSRVSSRSVSEALSGAIHVVAVWCGAVLAFAPARSVARPWGAFTASGYRSSRPWYSRRSTSASRPCNRSRSRRSCRSSALRSLSSRSARGGQSSRRQCEVTTARLSCLSCSTSSRSAR